MKRKLLLFNITLFVFSAFIQAGVNNVGNYKNFHSEIESENNLQQVKTCDLPEINYFKIKNTVPNDEWTVDVTFEFVATNTECYRLTHDCYDYGYSYDYIINDSSYIFTIHNVEIYFTNYFRLYAINSCNQESKVSEIVLEPVNTAVETNPIDSIEIKTIAGNFFVINSFNRNLAIKVYSIMGVCLLTETLASGSNEFSMLQWSNIAIIRIEDNGKLVLTKKILAR